MAKRKICVVTGTRAEYGLLYWLMKEIQADSELELQVVATGMHLSPEFGLTYRVIEADGFKIDAKVEMLLSSDTSVGIAKSIGLGIIGMADCLDRLQPDILVLYGDRFEILAVAQAALVSRILIAHISGGDTTEGAFDEAMRHSITKMSHLHFVTNETSGRRVRQMGEDPRNIYTVGSLGLEALGKLPLLGRQELEEVLGFTFKEKNLLITFHPVTLEEQSSQHQFQELLDALEQLGNSVGLIFTKPNADTDGRILIRMIDEFVAAHTHSRAYASLGQLKYLSTIAQVDAVIGNSSSGLYEVPSFKKPTVNIGDRQRGRLQAGSVINCEPKAEAILRAVREAFVKDCSKIVNPYGMGDSARKIVTALKRTPGKNKLLKKHFYEVPLP